MNSAFTFLLLGPRKTLASFTTNTHAHLLRHPSSGFVTHIVFRSEVISLTPSPQPGEPEATFRLAQGWVNVIAEFGVAGVLPGRKEVKAIFLNC
jgi:hypothetical protein